MFNVPFHSDSTYATTDSAAFLVKATNAMYDSHNPFDYNAWDGATYRFERSIAQVNFMDFITDFSCIASVRGYGTPDETAERIIEALSLCVDCHDEDARYRAERISAAIQEAIYLAVDRYGDM